MKSEKMLRNVSDHKHNTEKNLSLRVSLCFIQSIQWRNQHGIDRILQDFKPPEVLPKYFAANYIGRDKNLNPCKTKK